MNLSRFTAAGVLVLALAAGCTGPAGTDMSIRPKARAQAPARTDASNVLVIQPDAGFEGDAALAMSFSFPGAAAYRTLATVADVTSIAVTLKAADGTVVATARVSQADAKDGAASVRFDSLKAGQYQVVIVAFDGDGHRLGEATQTATVAAGRITTLNSKLVLKAASPAPGDDGGGLKVVITVEDQGDAPTPKPSIAPSPKVSVAPGDGLSDADISGRRRYGFNGGPDFRSLSDEVTVQSLEGMQQAGAGWIRMPMTWNVVQHDGPDDYDWSRDDGNVKAARDHGLNVMMTFMKTAAFARPAGSKDTTPPSDPAVFARFCREVVKHYKTRGVHAYEIWNEPNLVKYFTSLDPVQYTALLKAAYKAIKEEDPTAVVVSAGLAPATSDLDGERVSAKNWVAAMYAHGAQGSFDALGYHPYTESGDQPTAQHPHWVAMGTTLRQLMKDHGDGDKTIWATECGVATAGTAPEDAGRVVSEAEQAAYVKEVFDLWETYDWAGPLFWYSYRDRGTNTDTRQNFYGVVRNDMSKKPSWTAFKNYMGTLK